MAGKFLGRAHMHYVYVYVYVDAVIRRQYTSPAQLVYCVDSCGLTTQVGRSKVYCKAILLRYRVGQSVTLPVVAVFWMTTLCCSHWTKTTWVICANRFCTYWGGNSNAGIFALLSYTVLWGRFTCSLLPHLLFILGPPVLGSYLCL